MRLSSRPGHLLLSVMLPMLLLALAGLDAHAQLQVIGRVLVSSNHASSTHDNYTYRLQVENKGEAATDVKAVATSFASATTIVQGKLSFPDIPAGGKATSTNTYTIQQEHGVAIDQKMIRFAFSAIGTPVADAGPDSLINGYGFSGQSVSPSSLSQYCCNLNGGKSYDPFGLPLTYSWSIVSKPPKSKASLSAGVPDTFFAPDLPGDYKLKLVVDNGHHQSAPSYVHLSTKAVAPRADAGWNDTIKVGQTVQLDGTRSVNPMNRPLTYKWSFVSVPSGSHPELSDPASPRPTFVATHCGSYKLQLQVTDGELTSAPATVTYTDGNTPPRADAGPDIHIANGSYGFLSANRSTDVNGDFLTYRWVILGGASLGTLGPVPNPDILVQSGNLYHVQLFVNDGESDSIATQVVSSEDLVQEYGAGYIYGYRTVLPAIAAVDSHGANPETVTLDGTASLTSDLIQGGFWDLREAPRGSDAKLRPSADGLTATIAPDEEGLYIAQFYDNSHGFNSYPTAVSFLKHGGLPVANPGATQFGLWTGPTVHTLDGSGSWDPDGRELTYRWSLLYRPLGSKAELSNAKAVSPTFTADVDGTYIFQLVVDDGLASSAPATVSVISKDSVAPTALDTSVNYPSSMSSAIPTVLNANDPLLDPSQYSGQLNSLPVNGFFALGNVGPGGSLPTWGTDGIPADNPFGYLGADTLVYVPFDSDFVGSDSFTFFVKDLGYPSGCRTPGNYCIAPKTSALGTVSILVFYDQPQ